MRDLIVDLVRRYTNSNKSKCVYLRFDELLFFLSIWYGWNRLFNMLRSDTSHWYTIQHIHLVLPMPSSFSGFYKDCKQTRTLITRAWLYSTFSNGKMIIKTFFQEAIYLTQHSSMRHSNNCKGSLIKLDERYSHRLCTVKM